MWAGSGPCTRIWVQGLASGAAHAACFLCWALVLHAAYIASPALCAECSMCWPHARACAVCDGGKTQCYEQCTQHWGSGVCAACGTYIGPALRDGSRASLDRAPGHWCMPKPACRVSPARQHMQHMSHVSSLCHVHSDTRTKPVPAAHRAELVVPTSCWPQCSPIWTGPGVNAKT